MLSNNLFYKYPYVVLLKDSATIPIYIHETMAYCTPNTFYYLQKI